MSVMPLPTNNKQLVSFLTLKRHTRQPGSMVSCVIYTGLDWEEGFPSLFPSTSRTASSKYVLVWPYQTNLAQRKVSPLEEYWRSPALVSRSMTYPAIFHRISSEPYLLTTWPSASVEALFMPLKDISNMQWTLSKGGHYRMASNLLLAQVQDTALYSTKTQAWTTAQHYDPPCSIASWRDHKVPRTLVGFKTQLWKAHHRAKKTEQRNYKSSESCRPYQVGRRRRHASHVVSSNCPLQVGLWMHCIWFGIHLQPQQTQHYPQHRP